MKRSKKIADLQNRIEMDLRINDAHLSRELKEQSAKFSYWAAAAAIKSQEYLQAKHTLAVKEAVLGREINEKLLQLKKVDPNTRASDKVVKDRVVAHPDYAEAFRTVLELGVEEGIAQGAKEAFRQRAQMLLEMARAERAEMTTPEAVFTKQLKKEMEED